MICFIWSKGDILVPCLFFQSSLLHLLRLLYNIRISSHTYTNKYIVRYEDYDVIHKKELLPLHQNHNKQEASHFSRVGILKADMKSHFFIKLLTHSQGTCRPQCVLGNSYYSFCGWPHDFFLALNELLLHSKTFTTIKPLSLSPSLLLCGSKSDFKVNPKILLLSVICLFTFLI